MLINSFITLLTSTTVLLFPQSIPAILAPLLFLKYTNNAPLQAPILCIIYSAWNDLSSDTHMAHTPHFLNVSFITKDVLTHCAFFKKTKHSSLPSFLLLISENIVCLPPVLHRGAVNFVHSLSPAPSI